MNKHVTFLFSFLIFCYLSPAIAQDGPAELSNLPEGSYVKYFKYLNRNGQGMPPNATKSAKGVLAIEDMGLSDDGATATAFLIHTNRSDGYICLLTAGHIIPALKPDPHVGDVIPIEVILNYFGRDDNGYSKTISGVSTIAVGHLVAYQNPDDGGDYAILTVDPRFFPVKTVSTLGYDLNYVPSASQYYYTLGHPHGMCMRIADSLHYESGGSTIIDLSSENNNNTGPGSSGGPLFTRNTTSGSDAVMALLIDYGEMAEETSGWIPENEIVGEDRDLEYDTQAGYVRLSAFANQIRTYAQQSGTSTFSVTDPYLDPQDLDNTTNWNAFQLSASANNLSGLDGVSNAAYTTQNPNEKLVRANALMMNFEYQATAASQNLTTYCLATQSNLESGFSYTAASNTEFSVYSVVPESSTTTTSRSVNSEEQTSDLSSATTAIVYPNPSNTGIFITEVHGSIDVNANYLLEVFSSDGKQIYQSSFTSDLQKRIDIHEYASGTYFIIIRDSNGNVILRKPVIYLNK
ncbi:T9SS type A sorting domain-containing protein [Taibaiella soli]|nr:T9SS type A sorting domain-containing protein [Taibaiella soli]